LFDGGALEPKVVFLVSDEERGYLAPREEALGAVLAVDRNDDKEDVLETVGRGDDGFFVPDDIVSGR